MSVRAGQPAVAAGSGSQAAGESSHPWSRWVVGARPRTLAAAAVPVAVGTAAGSWHGELVAWRAVTALVVALAVQIGTNYANDVADGVRGTDSARIGPVRLVASGLATPRAVRVAAAASFAVAALAGLALAAVTSWWLVPVGAGCFAAGWLYTGGPKPYGYLGLGELAVFAFFGVVATVGAAYVQAGRVTAIAVVAAVPVGFLATALLEANNLRDVAGDAEAGKRTLAVRLGRRRAGWLYVGCLVGTVGGLAGLATFRPPVAAALVAFPLAARPLRLVVQGSQGPELLPVLGATSRLQLVVGAIVTAAILW